MTSTSFSPGRFAQPGRPRRLLTSLSASLGIVGLLAVAGVLVVERWQHRFGVTGQLEVRPSDGLLAPLVVAAVLVAARLVVQTRSPHRVTPLPRPVRTVVRRAVETSTFGVGPRQRWTIANPAVGLDRVARPAPVEEPSTGDDPRPGSDLDSPTRTRARPPTPPPNPTSAPDGPVIEAWAERVVDRGDTFWSLAEATVGDGRAWVRLRDANLGREVAPGVVFGGDELPVRGWRVLVPVVSPEGEPPTG